MWSGIPATADRLWTSAELLNLMARRRLAAEVAAGRLARIRRGWYAHADLPEDARRAAALHGRLDCVSLMRRLGVFVRDDLGLHIQCENGTTDVGPTPGGVVRHWRRSGLPAVALSTDVVSALARSCLCQPELPAVATLESAWHTGVVDEEQLAAVFALLPRRLRRLRGSLDRRGESGPETILRLLLLARGYRVDIQVVIAGVGRVDLLVDGWLIVECDSRAHHADWSARRRDLRRDQAAASLGFTTFRPIAEDILWHTDAVVAAVVGLLRARGEAGVRNIANPTARVVL